MPLFEAIGCASDFVEQSYRDNNNATEHQQADIGELIRLKFLSNKKLQLSLLALIVITFIAVLTSSLLSWSNTSSPDEEQAQISEESKLANNSLTSAGDSSGSTKIRSYQLTMPDNFDLYLSEHQGVIVHWQADEVTNGTLWSQISTQGDKSCKSISFNKGKDIRTLTVQVENSSDYYALFSPLDSKELIQALAFRGNFSLCDYKFSLKGSQAALGKSNHYANFLN